MATSAADQAAFTSSNDDASKRSGSGGKRKRENNQFDTDSPPSTRRQPNRSQYNAHSPDVVSNTDDAAIDPATQVSQLLQESEAQAQQVHQSNNQFDLGALAEHNQHHRAPSQSNTNSTVPSPAVVAAAGQATAAAALHQDFSMNVPPHPGSGFGEMPTAGHDDSFGLGGGDAGDGSGMNSTPNKPAVGSEEWHKVRKDNHKEVERRRRETINEGINELAKIVPGCEKNKGSILARAVQYIQKLQEDASTNIDKWTFEKLVTEQAINELSDKVTRAYREKEIWKRLAKEHGADVDTAAIFDDNDNIINHQPDRDDAADAQQQQQQQNVQDPQLTDATVPNDKIGGVES